jgi:16S rRNA (uracil1498-N3)-methyltransferase
MQRFFVRPVQIENRQVTFTPEQSRQIASVLRMRPGERVVVLDNAGWLYDVELAGVSPAVTVGAVHARALAPGEPRTKVTLYPALIKADKLEVVFQKCTELGVSAFVPIVTRRTVLEASISEGKRTRWERIIAEAAEQSERGRLPQLFDATLFDQAVETARGRSFIAWERGERPSLRAALRTGLADGDRPFAVNLFVGPEGGFTGEEVAAAQSYGIVPVSLGPRILRAETASVVGSALILAELGDLE